MSTWRTNGLKKVGTGWVGDVFSPISFDWGTGTSSMGWIGLPETRSNMKMKPCFVSWTVTSVFLPSLVMCARIGGHG